MWLIQWAKSNTEHNEFGIPIRNFGKVTDAIYRGALPKADGYRALAGRLGVRRVSSLTDRTGADEQKRAFDAGITEWVHIPFGDREAPPPRRIKEWLRHIRTAESEGPTFTHCMGGRHRTGVCIGVYRVADCGWTKEQAVQEMLTYGWYDARGHRPLLDWFLHEFDPKDYAAEENPVVGSELKSMTENA